MFLLQRFKLLKRFELTSNISSRALPRCLQFRISDNSVWGSRPFSTLIPSDHLTLPLAVRESGLQMCQVVMTCGCPWCFGYVFLACMRICMKSSSHPGLPFNARFLLTTFMLTVHIRSGLFQQRFSDPFLL